MLARTLSAVLLAGVILSGPLPARGEGADSLLPLAESFAGRFLEDQYERLAGMMSDEMRAAFPREVGERIRQSLLSQHGSPVRVGNAWLDDVVEGYRRVRVPVEFERGMLDFRVVFDTEDRVAGFFQAPHVPSPDERGGGGTPPGGSDPRFQGRWEGAVEIPGTSLGVLVELRPGNAYWEGTVDIPLQGATGLPLTGIRVAPPEVEFAIAGIPGNPTFRGELRGEEIAGIFTQSGQEFPFRLGRGAGHRARRPQDPEPPFPYEEVEVSIRSGDVTLAGVLTLPPGDDPVPAALLISGSGPQDRDEEILGHRPFLVLADHLSRHGIAVLRLDDRGVGGSSGIPGEATSEDLAGDALAAVRLLRERPEIDPERVGLIGHSEGGLIAPLAAARSPQVAFVVMLAGPGMPGREILPRQIELISRAAGMTEDRIGRVLVEQRKLLELIVADAPYGDIEVQMRALVRVQSGGDDPGDTLNDLAARETLNVTTPWFRYFLRHDPGPVLEELRVPVLALGGEKDLQVDPKQNLPEIRRALERADNPDATVREMPGLNHLFQRAETGNPGEYALIEETMNPAALETITAWILERFGTRGATR